jgi:hypothetical protein
MRLVNPTRIAVAALAAVLASPTLALEPGQSTPKRLYSNGDSITRGFDADLPLDNLNASWVNGYFGFWEWLFGLPNVKSHNQRISANFGSSSRKNWIAAENGARVDDPGLRQRLGHSHALQTFRRERLRHSGDR